MPSLPRLTPCLTCPFTLQASIFPGSYGTASASAVAPVASAPANTDAAARAGGACGTGLSCGIVLFALDPPGLDHRDLTEDLTEDSEDI